MLTVDQLLEIKKSCAHKIREGGLAKSITIFCPYLGCHQDITNTLDVSMADDSVFHYLARSVPE
jgi:hypothetical protein